MSAREYVAKMMDRWCRESHVPRHIEDGPTLELLVELLEQRLEQKQDGGIRRLDQKQTGQPGRSVQNLSRALDRQNGGPAPAKRDKHTERGT